MPKPVTAICQNRPSAPTTTAMTKTRLANGMATALLMSVCQFHFASMADHELFDQCDDAIAAGGEQASEQHGKPDLRCVVREQRIEHHRAEPALGAGPFRGDSAENSRRRGDLEAGEKIGN